MTDLMTPSLAVPAGFDAERFYAAVAVLERLAGFDTLAEADPRALPPTVATGDLITSAWGNQVSASVARLFSYQVPRLTFNGNVTVNASGAFAITTGFPPSAALCVTTQQLSVPFLFATITLDATQCVFRAFTGAGASPANTTVGVSYVVFGPPVVP